eukprot:GHVU01077242.1.p3 GENE.GHVU01077242.1~~GHVU01077242.1.p3  ORF type:complete len:179 (+),score=28.18 GHVU01077242.1:47-538(+)
MCSDSDEEYYGRGSDSDAAESLASAISEASCDEGLELEDIDPTCLIPHGFGGAEAPEQLADAIGKRVLVKVTTPKGRTQRGKVDDVVTDWWSGKVVSDVRGKAYAEMRNLGHTLVVEFDPVYRSCGYAGDTPARKSFDLYKENYGKRWLLYHKLCKSDALTPT